VDGPLEGLIITVVFLGRPRPSDMCQFPGI